MSDPFRDAYREAELREIREAELRGVRAGLERAAKECFEREALNDAVEGPDSESASHRADEAGECAVAIRALDPETIEVPK